MQCLGILTLQLALKCCLWPKKKGKPKTNDDDGEDDDTKDGNSNDDGNSDSKNNDHDEEDANGNEKLSEAVQKRFKTVQQRFANALKIA